MKKKLFFLLLFFDVFFSKCLVLDNEENSCEICSFDEYFLQQCYKKSFTSITRNILILSESSQEKQDVFGFDAIYKSLSNGLISENEILLSFYKIEATFFLSKGDHSIIFALQNQRFFHRSQSLIKIKPLLCSEYHYEELCLNSYSEQIKISVKSFNFQFFVSGVLILENIVFSFSLGLTKNIEDKALFLIEYVFDDPNARKPLLKLLNCSFEKIYLNCFIKISLFAGNIAIFNTTFYNFFFNYFFFYDSSSLSSQNMENNIKEIKEYFKVAATKKIIWVFETLLFNNDLSENIANTIYLKTIFFYIRNFNGELSFKNIKVVNINGDKANSSVFIFLNVLSPIYLENISFCYAKDINFLKMEFSQALIRKFFINNSSSTSKDIIGLMSTHGNIFLSLAVFQNISFSETKLFDFNLCLIKLTNISLLNVKLGENNFISSNIFLVFSKFISIEQTTFYYEKCLMKLENSYFIEMSLKNSLFFFADCKKIFFSDLFFYEIKGEDNLFDGQITSFIINKCDFSKMADFIFIFSSKIDEVYLLGCNFAQSKLIGGFMSFNSPVLLFIYNSNFTDQNLNDNNSMGFIFVSTGTVYFLNSTFQNISLKEGGCFVFELDIGEVIVKNSNFINNGWTYEINPSFLGSIEYITLFYLWGDAFIYFYQSIFINSGNFSLFSGFLESMVDTKLIIIKNCTFQAVNKSKNYFYHGILIRDAQKALILNNIFSGLQCPNYNSLIHNYGVLSIIGESSLFKAVDSKICFFFNNSFSQCKCQNGGSFGIMNFNKIIVLNTIVKDSKSTKKGGVFLISNCFFVFIQQIYVIHTFSNLSSVGYLQNINIFHLKNGFIGNSSSLQRGCFLMQNLLLTFFENLSIIDSFTQIIGGVFFSIGGTLTVFDSFFLNCSCSGRSAVFHITKRGNMDVKNVFAAQILALNSPFLSIDLAIAVRLKDIYLYQIQSYSKGIFYIESVFYLKILYALVEECGAVVEEGIIYITNSEKLGYAFFDHLICKKNYGLLGSCIYTDAYINMNLTNIISNENQGNPFYFKWNFPINFTLINITITNLRVAVFLIFFFGVNFEIENLIVENCEIIFSGLEISSSKFSKINNLVFQNNQMMFYTRFFSISDSEIILMKVSIENIPQEEFQPINFINSFVLLEKVIIMNVLLKNNILIIFDNCYFEITNSYFLNNSCPVLLGYDSYVSIASTLFLNNSYDKNFDGVNFILQRKYSKESLSLNIKNSYFLCEQGNSVLIENINNISIFSSIFRGYNNSQGIISKNFDLFYLINSSFAEFNGTKGSALILSGEQAELHTIIRLNQCKFIQNKAEFGGAIYIEKISNILIENSSFSNNKALMSKNKNYGIGGAIILKNRDFGTNSIINCEFHNNYAEKFIPTIFSTAELLITNISFLNNTSNRFSSVLYTSLKLKIVCTQNNADHSNNTSIKIVSGYPFNFTVSLLDNFDQLFITEKKISAKLIPNFSVLNKFSIKNSESLLSDNGTLDFENTLVKYYPGTFFDLDFTLDVLDYDLGVFHFTDKITFFSRPCLRGEIFNRKTYECISCPKGFYSLLDPMDDQNQNLNCIPCLPNAFCPGTKFLIPLPSFWRKNNETLIIQECPLSFSCLGIDQYNKENFWKIYNLSSNSNETQLVSGVCLFGHHKNLCYECMPGYGKLDYSSACEICDPKLINFIWRFVLAWSFIFAYLLVNAIFVGKGNSQIIDIVSKIYLNHMQKLNLIFFFSLKEFYSDFNSIFKILNKINAINEDVLFDECGMKSLFDLNDYETIYLFKLVISINFPFLATFLASFLLYLYSFYKEKIKHNRKDKFLFKKIVLMFCVSIFLFYPLINKITFSLMNCVSLTENESFLYTSPNIICWQSIHKNLLIPTGAFGICVWGFFFPFCLWLYFRSKKKISGSTINTVVKFKKKLNFGSSDVDKNIDLLNFFYRDYKEEYYFWESIIFFQKFLLTVIVNLNQFFIKEYINLLFLVILLIYLYLFMKCFPFKYKQMNKLEFISVIVVIFSKVMIIIQSDNMFENNILMLGSVSILIVSVNFLFGVLCIYYIIKFTKWKELLEKSMRSFGLRR